MKHYGAELTGVNVTDDSIDTTDIKDGTILLQDLSQEVLDQISSGGNSNTILQGAAIPNLSIGHVGDFYIDISTHNIYGPKTAESWGAPTSLIGPGGADGIDGANGINGTNGEDGIDGVNGTNGVDGKDGVDGIGFVIETIYNSTAELLASSVQEGHFGLVAGTLSTTDPDYGKLYLYTSNTWQFIVDMSIQGEKGIDGTDGVNGVDGVDGKDGATDGTHPVLWRDLFGPLSMAKDSRRNIPSWDEMSTSGIYAWKFNGGSKRELQISFHLDHDYKLGTDIFPHIHWVPESDGVGTVRWVMEMIYAKGHQQAQFNVGSPHVIVVEQSTTGTAWTHMVAETSASVITSDLEPDGLLMIRIFRDGNHVNDTYNGNVFGLNLDLHYQADRVGTVNKSPNFYGV